jgi:hypothetical protein
LRPKSLIEGVWEFGRGSLTTDLTSRVRHELGARGETNASRYVVTDDTNGERNSKPLIYVNNR